MGMLPTRGVLKAAHKVKYYNKIIFKSMNINKKPIKPSQGLTAA